MPEHYWHNADGSMTPITKATADAALPDPEGPSQEFLQALVAAEQDRLRAEGWRACVDHIGRKFNGWLWGEDIYWVGRQNPYTAEQHTNPGGRQVNETTQSDAPCTPESPGTGR